MRRLFDVIRRDPVMLPGTETVRSAAETMQKHKVGAILVVTPQRQLEGIFTARDAVWRVLAAGKDPAQTLLRDVMTRDLHRISPEKIATDALQLMEDCGCRHLPVVENGEVVGIVSRIDFLGSEFERIEKASPRSGQDSNHN